jgi:isochorismate synthase
MKSESTTYNLLSDLQTVCLKQNIPFASYRLPLETEITTIVQSQSAPEKLSSLDTLNQKSGFIVAPFLNSENNETYFLQPDNLFYGNNITTEFIKNLSSITQFVSIKKPSVKNNITTLPADFIDQVNNAKIAIVDGNLHKVVLSKIRVEELEEDFNASVFFLKLCEKYPTAFLSLIQLPDVGCWIGASPELLLLIENERVKTVSLAGTQIVSKDDTIASVWNQKEIEEQSIVTDFVEQTLHSLDIKNYNIIGPTNYRAANLIHLKTDFEFAFADLKNRLGEFIEALHPTPSVGGLPKKDSIEYILANEKHDRGYYTGYLGPVNINNKSEIFVNLRCLQLFENHFILYSGAGITSSSIAEREWEETDNKMMTMLNVMMTPNP